MTYPEPQSQLDKAPRKHNAILQTIASIENILPSLGREDATLLKQVCITRYTE
jgi:hypothetical protein